jgi:hypothetical protein
VGLDIIPTGSLLNSNIDTSRTFARQRFEREIEIERENVVMRVLLKAMDGTFS